jgi:hypothetical protein
MKRNIKRASTQGAGPNSPSRPRRASDSAMAQPLSPRQVYTLSRKKLEEKELAHLIPGAQVQAIEASSLRGSLSHESAPPVFSVGPVVPQSQTQQDQDIAAATCSVQTEMPHDNEASLKPAAMPATESRPTAKHKSCEKYQTAPGRAEGLTLSLGSHKNSKLMMRRRSLQGTVQDLAACQAASAATPDRPLLNPTTDTIPQRQISAESNFGTDATYDKEMTKKCVLADPPVKRRGSCPAVMSPREDASSPCASAVPERPSSSGNPPTVVIPERDPSSFRGNLPVALNTSGMSSLMKRRMSSNKVSELAPSSGNP